MPAALSERLAEHEAGPSLRVMGADEGGAALASTRRRRSARLCLRGHGEQPARMFSQVGLLFGCEEEAGSTRGRSYRTGTSGPSASPCCKPPPRRVFRCSGGFREGRKRRAGRRCGMRRGLWEARGVLALCDVPMRSPPSCRPRGARGTLALCDFSMRALLPPCGPLSPCVSVLRAQPSEGRPSASPRDFATVLPIDQPPDNKAKLSHSLRLSRPESEKQRNFLA